MTGGPERRPGTGRPVLSVAIDARCAASAQAAPTAVTGTKRTRSPARSWPSFQRSAAITVAGQTNPPRLGPSGPRMTGMSPVKSMVPTA